ncbi:hypothetical protein BT63DRAFT_138004 [Microthyrium microscopicum]|uniref:Membrane anchor Opy2 N-terminal domain-containing protein n=1 Tax=Microthyrium microscopicum TaxID=703497 RepID=A0A6A6UMV0_9PEZI|nr:hypothetical protein BT63DRAFT_138004 [Microthyrium microscopicum]
MTHSPFDIRSKNLFKRCVQCSPLTSAACPKCDSDQVCTLLPATCDQCPQYTCESAAESGAVTSTATAPTTHKSPAPEIAGGVIGGVLLIAALTYLIWKCVLKGKRHEVVEEEWDPMDYPMEKPGHDTMFSREARSRASTHTVTSMASTVLTRASNVIQIAFIPGVTTRQQQNSPTTPSTLVPPVPPIPIPTNPGSSHAHEEQMLFLPGDIRDSTWSGMSDDSNGRQSIAPSLARTSIASTMYKDNAVAVSSLKPSIVSVSKHGSMNSTPVGTPSVPSLDMRRFPSGTPSKPVLVQMPVSREGEPSSTGRSPVGSMRGLKPKAVMLSKGKTVNASSESLTSSPTIVEEGSSTSGDTPPKKYPSSPLAQSARIQSLASTLDSPHGRAKQADLLDETDDEASPHERSRQSLLRKESSPFSDSAALSKKAVDPRTKTESPFDDKNEL